MSGELVDAEFSDYQPTIAARVFAFAERVHAHVGAHWSESGHWLVAMEWGHEAPDSPMVGAAAYGTGATLDEAFAEALADVRGA